MKPRPSKPRRTAATRGSLPSTLAAPAKPSSLANSSTGSPWRGRPCGLPLPVSLSAFPRRENSGGRVPFLDLGSARESGMDAWTGILFREYARLRGEHFLPASVQRGLARELAGKLQKESVVSPFGSEERAVEA